MTAWNSTYPKWIVRASGGGCDFSARALRLKWHDSYFRITIVCNLDEEIRQLGAEIQSVLANNYERRNGTVFAAAMCQDNVWKTHTHCVHDAIPTGFASQHACVYARECCSHSLDEVLYLVKHAERMGCENETSDMDDILLILGSMSGDYLTLSYEQYKKISRPEIFRLVAQEDRLHLYDS
jgi:hypothetical protein